MHLHSQGRIRFMSCNQIKGRKGKRAKRKGDEGFYLKKVICQISWSSNPNSDLTLCLSFLGRPWLLYFGQSCSRQPCFDLLRPLSKSNLSTFQCRPNCPERCFSNPALWTWIGLTRKKKSFHFGVWRLHFWASQSENVMLSYKRGGGWENTNTFPPFYLPWNKEMDNAEKGN
jgi:hypothetical protein